MSDEVATGKLVRAYIKMRAARAALKVNFEEQDKAIRDQMDAVEQHLLETCKKAGADSIKTKNGTVIRGVLENQAPELLERRISQSTMKEFLANNPDSMPPGLNADSRYTITIRRASGS